MPTTKPPKLTFPLYVAAEDRRIDPQTGRETFGRFCCLAVADNQDADMSEAKPCLVVFTSEGSLHLFKEMHAEFKMNFGVPMDHASVFTNLLEFLRDEHGVRLVTIDPVATRGFPIHEYDIDEVLDSLKGG